mgnify:CR=1 FL=1
MIFKKERIEIKRQNEENQKIKEEKERVDAKEKLRLDNENQQKKKEAVIKDLKM